MPQINLLPWRVELRKDCQMYFLISVGAAMLAAVIVVGGANLVYGSRIDGQKDRNNLLDREIKVLNESIKEIEGIDRQKERLIARMEVIEELQQSRPEIVHLFDEITRNLPDGVTLNAITQQGRSIRLNGVAQSSTRVSSLMRNFDDSEWVDDPDLERIETIDGGQTRERFDFTLRATQVNPNAEEEGLQ